MRYCAGIDIGGTTVKCGLFTTEGRLIDKWEVVTRKGEGDDLILPDVAESLKKKLEEEEISTEDLEGIGMGVPGPVEPDGRVLMCVNLGWKYDENRYPARRMSQLMGGIPCVTGNDANVAALGEMWQGGGKGHRSLVAVTLGTGVGGGIIIDGKILSGAHGLGGEIGHMHVREDEMEKCNCGGQGCLEQACSATGILREAKRTLAASDKPSAMRDFGDELTCKDVCDCAKAGDELAVQSLNVSMKYLALGLSLITQVIDPEVFVIGGGVSRAGTFLIDLIHKYYDPLTPMLKKKPEINLAELGNDAGIYGAARQVID